MAEDDRRGPGRRPPSTASMLRLTGVGLELAAAIGGLTYVGYLADKRFGWYPWGTLIGALLGIVGGCYNTIKAFQRLNKRDR